MLTAKSPATFYMKKNTESDLKKAEKILGFSIPKDLHDFYINVNIMVYPYNTYSMNGEQYHIYRFESLFDYISISERGEWNIGGLISTSLEISKDPDFPINKGLFFAISDFGDLFYVSADEETFGNVFSNRNSKRWRRKQARVPV